MARRIYHGVAGAHVGDSYRVNVHDTDIAAGFHFNEGDLLVVFFAEKNTIAQPHLVIYNGDTNYEVSTTNDIGMFIKQQDVEADCTDAWDDGETVAFVYTQKGTGGTYYWEMINGVHASTAVYGDTKLFDDTNFDSWIIAEPTAIDSKIALTPNTLKKLYQLLVQPQDQEEEEEEERPLGLKWEPSQSGTLDILGYLSLGDGTGVEITYPLNSTIQAKITELGSIPDNTNQLTNGGEKNNPDGGKFVTQHVNGNLYFDNGAALMYPQTGSGERRRIVLNNNNDEMVIGVSQDNALARVVFGRPVRMINTLRVEGEFTAVGNARATTFIENGTSLKDKYSPLIKVVRKNHKPNNTGQIAKNTTVSHAHISVAESGWTPLGVVGYNVNMVENHPTTDGWYANVWECYLKDSTTVEYSIYNLKSADIYVQIDVYVLYKKNI